MRGGRKKGERERMSGDREREMVLNHFLLILILSFEYFITSHHGETITKARSLVLRRRVHADEVIRLLKKQQRCC